MATTPHYALFVNPNDVASVHDYSIHKDVYVNYLDYLLKLPEETHHLQGDLQNRYWAVCGDKAYIGPPTDTPDEQQITPKKGQLTIGDRAQNDQVNRLRVPIEQYFGRMLQLWGVARNVYRYDHRHFQTDIENWSMLTNESIKV